MTKSFVDWHTHCYELEHRGAADMALRKQKKALGDGKADPALYDAMIEESGVEQFNIIPIPRFAEVNVPNEFIAEQVARYPGRAVGFCSVHPFHKGAADEFRHCLANLGLQGIKLSPTYQAMDPLSLECWRIYEIAAEFAVPVMFHCGGAYTGSLEFANPWRLDKIALELPELKIIIAHFGQPYMEETAVMMRKNENMFADLSARYHRPWQLYHGLMVAIEYKVHNRLLFGSDFPNRTTNQALELFRNINDWGSGAKMPLVPDHIIEEIIHDRPLSLLGLKPS